MSAPRIAIRLPDQLSADLKRMAAERHRSVSNLAAMALADFVKAEKAASGQN